MDVAPNAFEAVLSGIFYPPCFPGVLIRSSQRVRLRFQSFARHSWTVELAD
jgi:hypothetical protein